MLSYVKAFTMQVVPSVAATIIGAYIVNHYIVAPRTNPDVPAAQSAAHSKSAAKPATGAKPADGTGDVASLPEAGVKAKGISEKGLLEKNAAAEKAVVEKPAEKDKAADKPAETASIPTDPRRHPTAPSREPREKAAAVRVIPLTPSQPAASTPAAPAPVVAAPASTPAAEAAPEERRDANELARAAIERLRTGDGAPRTQAAVRVTEPSRSEAAKNSESARTAEPSNSAAAPSLRPLPPPIMVSAPPSEAADPATAQPRPPYANIARTDDPLRPTPPAEIPTARPPLDIRAEMATPREKPSMTDEMLSAAKSMFQTVLPK